MIGAAVAIVLAAVGLSDRADLTARLEGCVPRSHHEALTCLDRILTPTEREDILKSDFVGLHERFNNEALLVAMDQAWLVDWDEPLRRDLRRHGAPDPVYEGRYSPSDLMLESYWLWRKGCELDVRRRFANARTAARQKRKNRIDDETLSVINIVADSPLPPFTPRCPAQRAAR